jgi:hypothetical protein
MGKERETALSKDHQVALSDQTPGRGPLGKDRTVIVGACTCRIDDERHAGMLEEALSLGLGADLC